MKAISLTNVYVVGAYQGVNDPVQFIEHWNGTRWKVMPNPFDFVIPRAIDGSSANDIWIVGDQRYGSFTEHYDGTAWSVVASPSPYGPSGVVDLSPNDAWTVGTLDVQHWNGRTWQVVKSPKTVELYSVTALAPDDVWAVGFNTRKFPSEKRASNTGTATPGASCTHRTRRASRSSSVSAAPPKATCTPSAPTPPAAPATMWVSSCRPTRADCGRIRCRAEQHSWPGVTRVPI